MCFQEDSYRSSPDDHGQVGEIVVETKEGTQVLSEPRHATEVKAADVSPTAPVIMKEEEVLRVFGGLFPRSLIPRSGSSLLHHRHPGTDGRIQKTDSGDSARH